MDNLIVSLVEHFIAFIATVLLKAKNLDSVYNMTLKLLRNNQFMHLYEEKILMIWGFGDLPQY